MATTRGCSRITIGHHTSSCESEEEGTGNSAVRPAASPEGMTELVAELAEESLREQVLTKGIDLQNQLQRSLSKHVPGRNRRRDAAAQQHRQHRCIEYVVGSCVACGRQR
mmetsp:Transcript_43085/g.138510  ORF Transcript_43085/g.138510 Transcript_43085/m.138510 type:complete len:110 (+) Transcript_43085:1706-2035(+)